MLSQISLGSQASQRTWIGPDKLYEAILYSDCCGGAGSKFPHIKWWANKKGLNRPAFLADNPRGAEVHNEGESHLCADPHHF